jgi:hypothetical protein
MIISERVASHIREEGTASPDQSHWIGRDPARESRTAFLGGRLIGNHVSDLAGIVAHALTLARRLRACTGDASFAGVPRPAARVPVPPARARRSFH